MGLPRLAPRRLGSVLRTNPYCLPLVSMYEEVEGGGATSWNQVEGRFLTAMSKFDGNLPVTFVGNEDAKKEQSKHLSGALQNGKGDWFNNLIAVLLERCSEVETLYVRRQVPGLIIPVHNLELRGLAARLPPPIPVDVPPSPAAEAAALTGEAAEE